jgi:phosphoserine phosphatase RsbU/P
LKEAQQAILVQPGDLPGARFAVFFNPMNGAGGDFYDVISLGEGISGYFTADIMGHDLKAAFITSALKALLRQNFNSLYTPAETMMLLNGVLRPLLSEEVVLSACCARINRRTGRMIFVSAGHPPIIHLMAGGGIKQLYGEGDLLCAFDNPTFETNEVLVSPGDRLLLFSDGLIEAYQGETVTRTDGMRYLIKAVEEHKSLPLAEMVNAVAAAVNPVDIPARDDLLLMGVEV